MIPRSRKFPLRTEFLSFHRRAQRIVTPLFTFHLAPCTSATRLAVIVPKKLSKLATIRNWLKRLTYDTLWPAIQDRQLDAVIVYKPLPLTKSVTTQDLITQEIQNIKRQITNKFYL